MRHRPHMIHVNDRAYIMEIDGLTYLVDPQASPEETTGWLHKHYRTEAFAAIRRAAEVARRADQCADEWGKHHRHDDSLAARQRADSIRRAIRYALQSAKR